MNRCLPDEIAGEACECFADPKRISPSAAYSRCQAGQGCVKKDGSYVCVSACTVGAVGPCACRSAVNNAAAKLALLDQACVASKNDANAFVVMPLARSNETLVTDSACNPVAPGSAAFLCEQSNTCYEDAGQTKCGYRCVPDQAILVDCVCVGAQAKTNSNGVQGQFCAKSGAVTSQDGQKCFQNSVVAVPCICGPGDQPNCERQHYCVKNSAAQLQCVKECQFNKINADEQECACRGNGTILFVPKGRACVLVDAANEVFSNEKLCANGQIGPCACKVQAEIEQNLEVMYTDANSACLNFGTIQNDVFPLIPVGSYAVDRSACPAKVSGSNTAIICNRSSYCLAENATDTICVGRCEPDQSTNWKCVCISSDLSSMKQIDIGYFCAANGEVAAPSKGLCFPNAMSMGECKCDANAQTQCQADKYCVGTAAAPQQCYDRCKQNAVSTVDWCACPRDPSNAPMARGKACLYYEFGPYEPAYAHTLCVDNKIGPCACMIYSNVGRVELADEWHACVKNSVNDLKIEPLCRTGIFTNSDCACQTATDGTAKYLGKDGACVQVTYDTRAALEECATQDVLTSDCACRIGGKNAAAHCAAGHKCYTNPVTNSGNACWRLCTDSTTCGQDSKCVKVSGVSRCVPQCQQVNKLVISSDGCLGTDQAVCEFGSAYVQFGGATHCLTKECEIGRINDEPCFCMEDGTKTGKSAFYTQKTQVCMEVDSATRKNSPLPFCTAEITQGCACRLKANDNTAVVCQNSHCIADPENAAHNVCFKVCAVGNVLSEQCMCGTAVCSAGQTCSSQKCAKPGLSAGAIAGIVIAVIVVVAGVGVGAFYALRAIRAKNAVKADTSKSGVDSKGQEQILARIVP